MACGGVTKTYSHKILVLFFKMRVAFENVLRMDQAFIQSEQSMADRVASHKFRNKYINVSEKIDLYMHQNASIYVFCMSIHIKYMY